MKRKILFLESRFDSFYGAQKSMLKLIQSLDQNDFEIRVVTTSKGKLSKELRENNVSTDIVELGKRVNVFGGKVLKYSILEKIVAAFQIFLYNFKILYYIKKNKIDMVYVNDLRALIYSVLATKILRKKNIWYIRADISNSILSEIGLRFSNNIITIADGVLRNLPKQKKKKYQSKITNIYTGFDFSGFEIFDKQISKEYFELSESGLVIGYVGSINKRKGLDFLIEAYIKINKIYKNTELLIVGDVSPGYSDYWEDLNKRVEENGSHIKHLSYSKEVSRVYSAMDVFILPSRSEGLPRVVIEAMGHKIPVIATDVGGTKEIIKNNINGFIIEKDNVEDLECALSSILKDEDKRHQFGIKGEEFVRKSFSEKDFASNINNYFLKIHDY